MSTVAAVRYPVDMDVDWKTMDDTGLPWTFVDKAADPARIVPAATATSGATP